MSFRSFRRFALFVVFPGSLVVLLRVIVPRGLSDTSLFGIHRELGWPRGVQEEEPVRYRVDLVGRDRSRTLPGGAGSPGKAKVRRLPQTA